MSEITIAPNQTNAYTYPNQALLDDHVAVLYSNQTDMYNSHTLLFCISMKSTGTLPISSYDVPSACSFEH